MGKLYEIQILVSLMFSWNMGSFINVVCGGFCTTKAELGNCNKHYFRPTKPKIFTTIWPPYSTSALHLYVQCCGVSSK